MAVTITQARRSIPYWISATQVAETTNRTKVALAVLVCLIRENDMIALARFCSVLYTVTRPLFEQLQFGCVTG